MSGVRGLSLRTRWLMLRARFSLPAMLSQLDETKVISVVAAIDGGAAILLISLAAWLTGLPLLFPALGPSAFILFTRPFSAAAQPRSVVLGHSIGIVSGWAAWGLVSAASGVAVSLSEPGLGLCLSANIGFMLTALFLVRFRCSHAPACASALIVATGAIAGPHQLLLMAGAVVLLTAQGILIHRLLGVNTPFWTSRARASE